MTAVVEIRGVSKAFGSLDVLAPTDLDVAAGEVVTLLGPSGCGKTTLLRMIAGLIETTAGAIAVNGAEPGRSRDQKLIGLVPQAPALLPWRTVRENARLLLDINTKGPVRSSLSPDRGSSTPTSRSVDELLADVGLLDFADAHPRELSGGMQQRVALARAFALDAPLLLMDEPFAALDEMTRTEMRHLLTSLRTRRSASVVFVTHSISEAVFLSDRVVVMSPRPGRITDIVPIGFAHPRHPELEDTPEFFEATARLRRALRAGADPTSGTAEDRP